jgi:hypothetical protein
VRSVVLRMILFPCAAVAYAQIHRPAALLWLGDEWEVNGHLRPFADVALGFDTTAVGLYYSLGDREAKPGAFLPARPGSCRPFGTTPSIPARTW